MRLISAKNRWLKYRSFALFRLAIHEVGKTYKQPWICTKTNQEIDVLESDA